MTSAVDRDVFVNGWYANHFRPDALTDPFHRLYAEKRRDVLAAIPPSPGPLAVLDLGGGMGRISIPLALHHRVTLSDISTSMLDLARDAATDAGIASDRLTYREIDASQPLPLESGTFDRVVALDLLVHLADPVATLREMRRVLRPDGRLVVDTTNRVPLWTLRYPRYVGRHPRRWVRTLAGGGVLPEWQRVVHHHTLGEFRSMLARAGFVVVDEHRYGPRGCPKWFLGVCTVA